MQSTISRGENEPKMRVNCSTLWYWCAFAALGVALGCAVRHEAPFLHLLASLKAAKHGFESLCEVMLWDMYFNGALVFWNGATEADICASMTAVPSDHWILHSSACTELLRRKFQALLTLITTPLMLYGLYRAMCAVAWYLFVWRPMLRSHGRNLAAQQAALARQSPLRQLVAMLDRSAPKAPQLTPHPHLPRRIQSPRTPVHSRHPTTVRDTVPHRRHGSGRSDRG